MNCCVGRLVGRAIQSTRSKELKERGELRQMTARLHIYFQTWRHNQLSIVEGSFAQSIVKFKSLVRLVRYPADF